MICFKKSNCLPAFAADASGYAGELQWSLENGNLTISDSGKMEDYAPGTAPWYAHKDDITSISYMETSGANLGVSSGTENVDIMADSAISFNGSIQSVGAADAIGTASIELNTAGDTETPFSVVVSKNTLSVYDGALEGELALNIHNNSGALRAASVITCLYDSNGNFVSVLKQTDTVLGHGENYTNIGGFNVNNVKEGSSIKCFVWDSLQSLEPLSEAISITVPNN